jgi:hypothetical protein
MMVTVVVVTVIIAAEKNRAGRTNEALLLVRFDHPFKWLLKQLGGHFFLFPT